jgi:hypothetical protein
VSIESLAEQVDVKSPPIAMDTSVHNRASTSANWEDLRLFLVACHQASVSIETMSRYLGIHGDTIRSELRLGIEAWNADRRRSNETAASPKLKIVASGD